MDTCCVVPARPVCVFVCMCVYVSVHLFTLFTVAVAPVHPASVAPEEAPGSDPAVRVAAVVVLSYALARVAVPEAGHLGPVHAPGAGLRDVYGPPVKAVSAAALDAVGERGDE